MYADNHITTPILVQNWMDLYLGHIRTLNRKENTAPEYPELPEEFSGSPISVGSPIFLWDFQAMTLYFVYSTENTCNLIV